ncbi:hypothetical protein CV093_08795 [Oceanobacillus sp. 143]|nr:hypothetical protein CV093_08795 [Oceanobacillus sp. 143]
MDRKKTIITVSLFFLLLGCGTDSTIEKNKQDTPINVSNKQLNQQPSTRAKDILNNHKEITEIKAVNNSKKLWLQ